MKTETLNERSELEACESIIEAGRQSFLDVADALATIREKQLYKERYSSFGQYCDERWGFSKTHAYRLIKAAEVIDSLPQKVSPVGDTLSERAVRELEKVKPEKRGQVLELALQSGSATAESIRVAAQSTSSKPKIDPSKIKEAKEIRTDELGIELPEWLIPIWDERSNMAKHMKNISAFRGAVKTAKQEGSEAWQNVAIHSMQMVLDEAYRITSYGMPYTACPKCEATGKDDGVKCQLCKGNGWIDKSAFGTLSESQREKLEKKGKKGVKL